MKDKRLNTVIGILFLSVFILACIHAASDCCDEDCRICAFVSETRLLFILFAAGCCLARGHAPGGTAAAAERPCFGAFPTLVTLRVELLD